MNIKKLLVLTIVLMLTATIALADTVLMAQKGGTIHIRAEQTRDSESKGIVTDGETITVLSKGQTWSRIQTKDNIEGFIKTLYINDGDTRYAAGNAFLEQPVKGATTANVRLRAGASTKVSYIDTIPTNTEITIIGTNADFYLVMTPDESQGYIHKNYVTTDQDVVANAETRTQENTEQVNTNPTPTTNMAMTTEKITMRESDTPDAKILKIIDKNTEVTIIEKTSQWAMIKYEDTTGWVKLEYLKAIR